MKSLSQRIRERHKTAATLNQSIFQNEDGAIDLASIMVGIIVIGLIAGVIAASLFMVVPWTQDNVAKQQLNSIVQAENAYYGESAAVPSPLPAGSALNSFTDSPGLANSHLLPTSPSYCVVTTNGGAGYQGYSMSATSAIWTVTNDVPAPSKFSGTLPLACEGMSATNGNGAAALPAVNTTKRLRFGVSVPDGPLSNEVTTVASQVNEYPSIVSTYNDWTTSFNANEAQAIYNAGSQPMITWEPWDASVGGATQASYTLASIYNGSHDAYIQSWINAIKAAPTPRPILMRFAHEMNGDWYPWGYNVNGNAVGTYDTTNHWATSDYAKAWRYVHDKFTAAGINSSKVQWVWAPNSSTSTGVAYSNFWPGANYVDYNGVDGFNWGTTQSWGSTWQRPWDVFSTAINHLNTDTDIAGKQIIVTEAASVQSEGANTQSQWISDLVNWLDTSSGTTNVVGFVYFDIQKMEGSQMIDWRFNATNDGITAMKNGLASRPN